MSTPPEAQRPLPSENRSAGLETSQWKSGKQPTTQLESELIGVSPAMQQVRKLVMRLARSPVGVLVRGESGTGKELVARCLHGRSPRSRRAYIAVNCAEFPETLVGSELFGHLRGSFTGAERERQGVFDAANHGTLFLDEIGDAPVSVQVKLLRFLETGEVRAVGATQPRKIDVRVLSATNAPLEELIERGEFRRDLYFRLSGTELFIPPLRDRAEDIPALTECFQKRLLGGRPHFGWTRGAWKIWITYSWPGNVRELKHEIVRLAALHDGGAKIDVSDLSRRLRRPLKAGVPSTSRSGLNLRVAMESFERECLLVALRANHGNKSKAAKELGISRQGLAKKLRRLGVVWTG